MGGREGEGREEREREGGEGKREERGGEKGGREGKREGREGKDSPLHCFFDKSDTARH